MSHSASIIDIGGGDSNLVDFLVKKGFEDITVLDISEKAIDREKKRLGKTGEDIKWIVSDITDFMPDRSYDVWHDRATFHFLTSPEHINQYFEIAKKGVKGYLVVGTFSDTGPDICSGLSVSKYSQEDLSSKFSQNFTKIKCLNSAHIIPFSTTQDFTYCSFKNVMLINK